MTQVTEEMVLRGLPISRGIGIGQPFFFSAREEEVPMWEVPREKVHLEVARYQGALVISRSDVKRLQRISLKEGPPEIINILEAHLQMLHDPVLTTEIEEQIRERRQNSESLVVSLINDLKARLSAAKDIYFQERVRDIIDVSRRVLCHLLPKPPQLPLAPSNSIILARDLLPSDAVEARASQIEAFVTSTGGITSHAAIIARAKGIPFVAQIDVKLFKSLAPSLMIVDGSQGLVILNPQPQTLEKYRDLRKGMQESFHLMQQSAHLSGETVDGYRVRIFANIEGTRDLDAMGRSGAAGIGLFRTEYLLFSKKRFPSEEEQFAIYRKLARDLAPRPVVIRIFDVGGDKKVDFDFNTPDAHYFAALGLEPNPALGCRAIRFLLRFPSLLDTQLRALLRASVYGDIHILIPMISDISELRQVRDRVEYLSEDLRSKGIKTAASIPVGCMIEVPSSALLCDALAREADFLSIGTNDLIQYVLAADRNNLNVSDIYSPVHPSILRLIRMAIASAGQFKKPLLLCGESAADPFVIPLMLGLGVREFSVSFRQIPHVKHIIRSWRLIEACQLVERALEFSSHEELKRFLHMRIPLGSYTRPV